MSSGELSAWEMVTGGETGSLFLDAVSATATATGLQCGAIDVRRASIFSVLAGWDVSLATAIDFRVDNNLTGYTIEPGMIFPGYGRYFTGIALTQGQVAYYEKRND